MLCFAFREGRGKGVLIKEGVLTLLSPLDFLVLRPNDDIPHRRVDFRRESVVFHIHSKTE